MNETLKSFDDMGAIVRAYICGQANPERRGCPSVQHLEQFLLGCLTTEGIDELYEHLSYCRECLFELKTLRDIAAEAPAVAHL